MSQCPWRRSSPSCRAGCSWQSTQPCKETAFLQTPLRRSIGRRRSRNSRNSSFVSGAAARNSSVFFSTARCTFFTDGKVCPQQPMQPPFSWQRGLEVIRLMLSRYLFFFHTTQFQMLFQSLQRFGAHADARFLFRRHLPDRFLETVRLKDRIPAKAFFASSRNNLPMQFADKEMDIFAIAVANNGFHRSVRAAIFLHQLDDAGMPNCLQQPLDQRPGKAVLAVQIQRRIFHKELAIALLSGLP